MLAGATSAAALSIGLWATEPDSIWRVAALVTAGAAATCALLPCVRQPRAGENATPDPENLARTAQLAAVGELAASVAHEVNNPLNTIINAAELITDGDDVQENGRVIAAEGERIAGIVSNLLQFTRADREPLQPTSLTDLAKQAQSLIGEKFRRHDIRLTVELDPDLPLAMARPVQIRQVLLILLDNARNAVATSDHDGHVTVSGQQIDGGIRVSVHDNGPEIPAGSGKGIFEPFARSRGGQTDAGLGLSISKSMVEDHGGSIAAQNAPDRGVCFSFWIPATEQS